MCSNYCTAPIFSIASPMYSLTSDILISSSFRSKFVL
nr:MAG TPA: hypothetical protein [Caudoviricetes sp.]